MNKKYNIGDLKKDPKRELFRENETKSKAKLGRPQKKESERLSKKVTVNLTEAEFQALKDLSEKNFGIPLPKLIRGILKQQKII